MCLGTFDTWLNLWNVKVKCTHSQPSNSRVLLKRWTGLENGIENGKWNGKWNGKQNRKYNGNTDSFLGGTLTACSLYEIQTVTVPPRKTVSVSFPFSSPFHLSVI